ncbi:uncharacterized protein PGTG_02177 [Puccinia graminis f. sp. tritici CRL 75-36-700-3]|uniref:Uncharacterized protein n=1 Tax=Puccinia graminis f. sp. tritici (strain CRL 75-36-700-3 / race SCCL) TaxID=418459 RepID=E3JXE1_PUCGT|nr:uncharacterized protein PGTG_02177 [Puccinia graminis f. sp. tritici CRL 75-36-700-3]EFP76716.1 hypothetical protein PGTG_02177 [Puccinia graminis f. sp. tritici CRL 75-36-700-3]
MAINKTKTALREPSEGTLSESGDSSSDESSSGSDCHEPREGRSEEPSDMKNENSPIPKTVDLSDCRELGDAAIRGFGDLCEKYSSIPDTDVGINISVQRGRSIAPSTDYSPEEHCHILTAMLLPMLKQQVVKIPLLPEPADSPTEAARKLKLIIELQAELNTTLGQIRFAVNTLRPRPLGRYGYPPDDQHWHRLKRFRLSGLNGMFEHGVLERGFTRIFLGAASTIRLRRLASRSASTYDTYLEAGIIDLTLENIDEMIRCLEGSELDLLQDDFIRLRDQLNSNIETLYSLAYPVHEPNGHIKPPSQQATQLAQLALPVAKLSRVFMNKVSRRGMRVKGFPLFTKMCSVELVTLSRLSREVSDHVRGMILGVKQAYTSDTAGQAEQLQERFNVSLKLIKRYILPRIPDTNDFPHQTYFKTWFATWSTEFDLSVHKLKEPSERLSSDDSSPDDSSSDDSSPDDSSSGDSSS